MRPPAPPPLHFRRRKAQGCPFFLSEAPFVPPTPHTLQRSWSWGNRNDRRRSSSCVLFTLSEDGRGSEAVAFPSPHCRSFAKTISFLPPLVKRVCSLTASKRVLCCDTSVRFPSALQIDHYDCLEMQLGTGCWEGPFPCKEAASQ